MKKDKFKVGDLVKFVYHTKYHYNSWYSDIGIVLKKRKISQSDRNNMDLYEYDNNLDFDKQIYKILWIRENYICENISPNLEKLS